MDLLYVFTLNFFVNFDEAV